MGTARVSSSRLDRIEILLEAMIEHHNAEFKHLLTWQVLMQDRHEGLHSDVRKILGRIDTTNVRIEALTSAIGELVSSIARAQGLGKE